MIVCVTLRYIASHLPFLYVCMTDKSDFMRPQGDWFCEHNIHYTGGFKIISQ